MRTITLFLVLLGPVACSKYDGASAARRTDAISTNRADTCPKGTSHSDAGCIAAISNVTPECGVGSVAVAGAMTVLHPALPNAKAIAVQPFCLDVTEVTVESYSKCVGAGACAAAIGYDSGSPWACNSGRPEADLHPINCVGWASAAAYCAWRHQRLPSQLEWVLAARGDGIHELERWYPWGSQAPNLRDAHRVNACGPECTSWAASRHPSAAYLFTDPTGLEFHQPDGWATTAPVGSFPAGVGRFGNLDLAGNVAEWTSDVSPPATPSEHEEAARDDHARLGFVPGDDHKVAEAYTCGGHWMSRKTADLVAARCQSVPQGLGESLVVPDWEKVRGYDTIGFRCAK